jgi:hypothetical protein
MESTRVITDRQEQQLNSPHQFNVGTREPNLSNIRRVPLEINLQAERETDFSPPQCSFIL